MNKKIKIQTHKQAGKKISDMVYYQYMCDKIMLDEVKSINPQYKYKELVLMQKFTIEELIALIPEYISKFYGALVYKNYTRFQYNQTLSHLTIESIKNFSICII